MLKKISYILVLLSMLNINSVFAQKINRIYYDDDTTSITSSFLIQYDTELKKYELGLPVYRGYQIKNDKEYIYVEDEYIIAYELGTYTTGSEFSGGENYHLFLNEGTVKGITQDESLRLYYCISDHVGGGPNATGMAEAYLFTDSVQRSEKEGNLPQKIKSCINLESNEAKAGETSSIGTCETYADYIRIIENHWKNYFENKDRNYLEQGNQKLESLKSICNAVTRYADYDDHCLKNCLNLQTWTSENQKKYGIYEYSQNDRICGFSEKLIIYIANIVKWGKYLVPVIVIVLGILDFIKAISADKDDEMKKAQGRFVKRLIAAALIFILPFIIEFVLDKMGFGANGCGIIDL